MLLPQKLVRATLPLPSVLLGQRINSGTFCLPSLQTSACIFIGKEPETKGNVILEVNLGSSIRMGLLGSSSGVGLLGPREWGQEGGVTSRVYENTAGVQLTKLHQSRGT